MIGLPGNWIQVSNVEAVLGSSTTRVFKAGEGRGAGNGSSLLIPNHIECRMAGLRMFSVGPAIQHSLLFRRVPRLIRLFQYAARRPNKNGELRRFIS